MKKLFPVLLLLLFSCSRLSSLNTYPVPALFCAATVAEHGGASDEAAQKTLKGCVNLGCCIARSGKLDRARSRLYRSQILQVNMRLKALVEIYTMHSFAQLQNHIFFKKLVQFAKICENFQKFCKIRNFSNRFFAKILRLQRCKRMQIL